MIVLSSSLVAVPPVGEAIDSPLIGSQNIVTIGNIAATSATVDRPATELANPATDLYWQATSTAEQFLTVTTGSADDLDHMAIAGHNLGTAEIEVSVEGDDGGGFDELVEPRILPDDRPTIFRFPAQPLVAVRLRLQAGAAAAAVAVLHAGLLLAVPRRIGVGHTPINYAGEIDVVHNQSMNGKYLGSIDLGRTSRTEIAFQNLDPDWFRDSLDPVLQSRRPFFWAWRPASYPREVGYVCPMGNPKPVNQRSNGMQSISLSVGGEA